MRLFALAVILAAAPTSGLAGDGSMLCTVKGEASLRDDPGGKVVGTLAAGRMLHAVDRIERAGSGG